MNVWKLLGRGLATVCLCLGPIGHAALLPGFGEVAGTVSGPPSASVVPVYLFNKERNVGYGVFAVNGAYRAVNLFPGRYEIQVQHWYAPSPDGFAMAPASVLVTAGQRATANLDVKVVAPTLHYTGREIYKSGVVVKSYDEIYPAGKGRELLEGSCTVCHGVNFIPGKALPREGWEAMANLMLKGPAEGGLFAGSGLVAGPPIVSAERLSAEELPVLLDYLAEHFGPDAEPRAVAQDEWPALDTTALEKAQFIDYRVPGLRSHSLNFDSEGIVYVTSGPNIIRVDPATAETRVYPLPKGNSTHGITIDGDGTVWSSGAGNFLSHLDPETGLFDIYPVTQRGLHGNTPLFDSNGDIWFSQLMGNKLGKWDRKSDSIIYYESPVANASPYGLDIDHQGKVWYTEYFTRAFVRFDPQTETFTRFPAKTWPNSLRRGGPDSRNNFWFGVYGYVGNYGKLGRIDAVTGEVTERDIPIKYGQPYEARPDEQDNIWISSMNFLTRFDPKTEKFTVYPLPARTDMPKLEPTQAGSIWFSPRYASGYGYGGTAAVLYPDKDAIETLRAIPSTKLSNGHIWRYKGPFTKVTGAVKPSKHGARNQVAYQDKTVGAPFDAKASEPPAPIQD
jgi:virginiamycin B lyase